MTSAVPEQVGPYRIEGLLGAGGMGAVYRAYDHRLGRRVAIKHVRPERRGELSRKRLLREARAAAALAHPAIVQVFDILESEDGDWIVMEYIEGQTLAQTLADGPLGVDATVDLAREIADGLAYAHSEGFIHRDLKTENVMISPLGRPKILDLGLVKRLSEAVPQSVLTVDGAVLGTCRAMSPEQARGFELDARSDLFSLGVLIYECLTAFSPFEGKSAAVTLNRICTHRHAPLSTHHPDIPEPLSALVDQLLEKLPEQRPESARQVVETLDRLTQRAKRLPSTTTLATDISEAETIPEWTDIKSSADGVASPEVSADPTTQLEPSEPRRRPRWPLGARPAALVVLLLLIGVGVRSRLLEERTGATDPQRATMPSVSLYQSGLEDLRHYYRPGAIDRAVETFEYLLTRDDVQAAPAYSGLGRAYLLQYWAKDDPQWLQQALVNSRRAVDRDPQLLVARVNLGLVQVSAGLLDEAEQELERVLTLDPNHAGAHHALGEALKVRGQRDRAEDELRSAIVHDDSGDWTYPTALGIFLYQEARYDEAEKGLSSGARDGAGKLRDPAQPGRGLQQAGPLFRRHRRAPEIPRARSDRFGLLEPGDSLFLPRPLRRGGPGHAASGRDGAQPLLAMGQLGGCLPLVPR